MIKLPNLDDQRYADIVEAAKRRIPVIFPEWTDFNEHDPGITILELFAWLKEMQQYYLNRISDESYENMLRLVGIEVMEAAPAQADAVFAGDVPQRLIKGAIAELSDGTRYVLEDEFTRSTFVMGDIFVDGENAPINITELNREHETDFRPFGSRLGGEGRCMYIEVTRFDPQALSDGFALSFEVSDGCPVPRNAPADGGTRAPRDIAWEYSTESGFAPCEVTYDGTFGLSFSGQIRLKTGTPAPFAPQGLKKAVWLRARLVRSGCEDMPRIRSFTNNFCRLTQKERLCGCEDLVLNGGKATVRDRLLLEGLCFVLVRDAHGWLYAQDAKVERGAQGAVIDVAGCGIQAADDGEPNVRVVFCVESFGRGIMFRSSDGLPCQEFGFDLNGELLTGELRIMAADRDGRKNPRWREFSYIRSLSLAGPYDRVFTYDAKRRRIVFGDNEHGEVPDIGTDNIMVISCALTKGRQGAAAKGSLRTIRDGGEEYAIIQPCAAFGGRGRESTAHALDRLRADVTSVVKAVTAEDYRTIALRTPGLRIADAKAIPQFDPAANPAAEGTPANMVTLVVLPYSEAAKPMPDEGFLGAVSAYIEDYRPITTLVKVCAPIYVSVDISADVVCTIREVEQARQSVEQVLRKMFSASAADGRAHFGEPVTHAAVTAAICAVEGILTVRRLQLNISDSRCTRDRYGRMMIPPHAIACCGRVDIEVTEP